MYINVHEKVNSYERVSGKGGKGEGMGDGPIRPIPPLYIPSSRVKLESTDRS